MGSGAAVARWQRASPRGIARDRCVSYLGSAPGVGKTYAMRAEGHRRRARGADVVVALVESAWPGRSDSRVMAEGPEDGSAADHAAIAARPSPRWTWTRSLPVDRSRRWPTSSRTRTCPAAERRAVAGRRGAARAGIDVITTLNIQHLESLERRDEADHRRAGSTRPAGRRWPPRRPDRAGRHDPGGAAAADGPRQRVPAGPRSRPRCSILPAGEPQRAAGAGPAVGRRPGRGGPAADTGPSTASPRSGKPGAHRRRHRWRGGRRGRRSAARPGSLPVLPAATCAAVHMTRDDGLSGGPGPGAAGTAGPSWRRWAAPSRSSGDERGRGAAALRPRPDATQIVLGAELARGRLTTLLRRERARRPGLPAGPRAHRRPPG